MTISEITDRVSSLGHAWEQYKQINDNRLREIENKGHADPLYDEHLHNISSSLDNYKKRLDQIETAYNRPVLGGENDGIKYNEKNSEYSKAFRNYLRKGMDAGLEALQTKALSVGSDPDGGYAAGTNWGQVQQIDTGSSGNVTADALIALFYSLKDAYMRRASFLMNRSTMQQVRQLKSTTNQYLWQPSLVAGAPDTLLGIPVNMAADMPVPAASSLSVAVADFQSAYQIVDRQGVRILRDPFTEKPFVKFYATSRVGGDVTNFDAIKLLKLI